MRACNTRVLRRICTKAATPAFETADPARQQELLEIAARCRRVPWLPPQPVLPLDPQRIPPVHPEDRADFFTARGNAVAHAGTDRVQ